MAQFQGISYPFRLGKTALPEAATDEDLIRDSLRQIILTPRYSRVMRPNFGCGAYAAVFENNTESLAATIQREVRAAIAQFEPRVIVTEVTASRDDSSIIIFIGYIFIPTKTPQQLAVKLPTAGP